jgi:predicted permease
MSDAVRPPRLARWLAARLLRGEAREAILGDLEERFQAAVATGVPGGRARGRYWRDALVSVLLTSPVAPPRPAPAGAGRARSSVGAWVRGLRGDLRYVVRGLVASPGFAAVAVGSLAIGIGANVAIVSVIRNVLLDDLPVRRPSELHWVAWTQAPARRARAMNYNSDSNSNFSYPAFVALRQAAAGQAEFFAFNFLRQLTVSASDAPSVLVNGMLVSREYFPTLGLTVERGRPIGAADEAAEAPPVAVISHALWLRLFGGDDRAVGQMLTINHVPFAIVGVTPAGYRGLSVGGFFPTADVTVPLSAQPIVAPTWTGVTGPLTADLNRNWLRGMVRLGPGTDPAGLARRFSDAFAGVEASAGGVDAGWQPSVAFPSGRRGLNTARQGAAQPLTILAVISGLVLLMACTNLAGLMLARGLARERDIAVRRALGASRAALVRQWVLESLTLASAGGLAGVLAAIWSGPIIARLVTAGLGPMSMDLTVDWSLVALATATTLLTALLCTVVPAIRLTGGDAVGQLRTRVIGAEAPKLTMGRLLLVTQVALAVPLLVGAFLFLRTLHNLGAVDLGFDARSLVLFDISPVRDPKADPTAMATPETRAQTSRLLARLEAIPGVSSATVLENALVSGWTSNTTVVIAGRSTQLFMNAVGPRFFETMHIPLVAGRALTGADDASAPPSVVINRAAAAAYFPTGSALGQSFRVGSRTVTIVGIAADSVYGSLRRGAAPMFYDSYFQRAGGTYLASVAVRTSIAADRLEPALRAAVASVDRELPITNIRGQQDQIDQTTGRERVFSRLLTLFGGFALLLVCIGLHGLTAYSVTRRTNEIGIRLALGAQRAQVLWMVLRQVVVLALIGLGLGVPVALVLSRFVGTLLYGVAPKDPLTVSSAVAVMLAVAFVAGWLPARRAARMEALSALRQD